MGANLLRHADTPLTPVRTIAVLGALSATPFLLLDEALELGLAALEAVRAVRDGGRPLEADEEADEGADVNEDASEDAERPERAPAREKEEEEADGADDEEDEEADDALASDGGGDDRVVGQLRAFLAAIRPAGAPASRVAEEVAEGAAAAEGAVVEEVRYATISLPVRGGQSFEHRVDGQRLTFTAPAGALAGSEAEFAFIGQRLGGADGGLSIPTRYVDLPMPVGGGASFAWIIDGVEHEFIAPMGTRRGETHRFTFPRLASELELATSKVHVAEAHALEAAAKAEASTGDI